MKKLLSTISMIASSLIGLLPVFAGRFPVSQRTPSTQTCRPSPTWAGRRNLSAGRHAVAEQMKEGVLLLFARQVPPEADHYREDNDFYYLTGVADPGAVLFLDGKNWT